MEGNSPNSRDGLDVPLQPSHDSLGLKVEHRYHPVDPPDGQEVAREDSPGVETRAEGGCVYGRLKVLWKVLRERICGERAS
jgi:hypothetical protein